MVKRIAYFDYGKVYPPLANGNPPLVEPDPAAPEPFWDGWGVFTGVIGFGAFLLWSALPPDGPVNAVEVCLAMLATALFWGACGAVRRRRTQ